jgi:hypothetical protein
MKNTARAVTEPRRLRHVNAVLVTLLIGSSAPFACAATAQETKAQPPPAEQKSQASQNSPPATNQQPPAPKDAAKAPASATQTPSLTGVNSQLVPLGPRQRVTINGVNLQDGATVTLTDPFGTSSKLGSPQTKRISETQMEVIASFDAEGSWKIAVQNPNGTVSPAMAFRVAASPFLPEGSPAVSAYNLVAWTITILLAALLLVVIVALGFATAKGWSLGDAVSEESSQQPKVITRKEDVVMVASSSRLIALLGLLGILTTVLAIGYAILWRLFVYGNSPDLTQVRNFLFASATLFAPYLANQLREIFSPSNPFPGPGSATISEPPVVGARITGIDPAMPASAADPQQVRFTGSGFQRGLVIDLTDPRGTSHALAGNSVTSVPTLANVNVLLDQPGEWRTTVTNPGEQESDVFRFLVTGTPTIDRLSPPAPSHDANSQKLVFFGNGFMVGSSLLLIGPKDAAVRVGSIKPSDPTLVAVDATIPVAGNWKAVITNPGNRDSPPFQFTVT